MKLSPSNNCGSWLPATILLSFLASLASAADFNVTTTADSGPGSLRQAILDANAAPGADTIKFAITGAGAAPVINITGTLPEITGTLTMEGTSQSGASLMEIKSSGGDAGDSIITIAATGCALKNIRLSSAKADNILLRIHSGNGNVIEGLHMGDTAGSDSPPAARHGIVVESDDNSLADCVIQSNISQDGVRISGNRNTIISSTIGYSIFGSTSAPGGSGKPDIGVHLIGGTGNIIGAAGKASSPWFGEPEGTNYIGGARTMGIHVEGGSGHRILSNQVLENGRGIPFTFPMPEGWGIRIDGAASDIEVSGARVAYNSTSQIMIAGPASDIRLADCVCFRGDNGVFVGNGVKGITIEDCSIGDSISKAGIRLEGGDTLSGPILIRHNSIYESHVGVLVVSGMGDVTVGTRKDLSFPASNYIFRNSVAAVLVQDPSAKVRISENVLANADGYSNLDPPVINLQGVGEGDEMETPNDPLDADSGPNNLQNKPVLTSLIQQPGGLMELKGTLSSKPSATYKIEAIGSKVSGSSSVDGAFLGSTTVSTNAEGNATFTLMATGCQTGWAVNLTATSDDGETSEYSNEMICPEAPPAHPLLVDQTSLSLPENESVTGTAFTIMRPASYNGATQITLSLKPKYLPPQISPDYIPSDLPPHLHYRLNPSDPWTDLGWNSSLVLTFSSGEGQKDIYLAATDDQSWDPQGKPCSLAVNTGSVTKDIPVIFPDNDPPPKSTLVVAGGGELGPRQESPTSLAYKIRQDRPASVDVHYEITVDSAESSATLDEDFTIYAVNPFFVPALRTESYNDYSYFLWLTIRDDALVEGDEVIAFRVASTTEGANSVSTVKIGIVDDDMGSASIGNASGNEGNTGTSTLIFPVSLTSSLTQPLTFNWTTVASGTAAAGTDFTAASGTVTIPAGATSGSIPVTVTGDTVLEPDETFSVRISSPSSSGVVISKAEAVGTIVNDDRPSVSIAGATVSESAGTYLVTATLSQAAPFSCSVSYTLADGSAVRNSDFTGPYSGTLNFPAGSTTASFAIAILNDNVVEPDETLSVQLSSPVNLSIGTASATITILDNDVPSLLKPAEQTVTEGDSGALTVAVPLVLSGAGKVEASVDWQVTPDSTAAQPASGTAFFAVGSTQALANIVIPGNLTPQPARQVRLAFSNPVNLTLPSSPATVIVVLDNDTRMVGGTGFSAPEGDSGSTQRMFRLTMSGGALDVPVTVEYQTVDGTAKAGSDYTAARGTATIPAGATETLIPVAISGDGRYEANESFTLALKNPENALLNGAQVIGTILNDDSQPSVTADPAVVTTALTGGPFQAWLEVKLKTGKDTTSESSDLPVSFKVRTRDGTALAGTHYTAVNGGTLTFQPGRAAEWIAIPVNALTGDAETRKFLVDFQPVDATGSAVVTAEVTIEPLRVMSFERLQPSWFYLQFPTGKGQNYLIQEAQSLAGPWVDNSSILQGSGSPVFQVVVSAKTRAYFRVRAFNNPPSTPAPLSP